MARDVLVVIGLGGMGRAIARRLGSGRSLLLADREALALEAAATALRSEGHEVVAHQLDVTDPDAVAVLADAAHALGPVRAVAHTAGVSPVQASAADVVAVDLVGAALVLEELGRVVAHGGAGVVIASMAGHLAPPMRPEDAADLVRTPARELGSLACVRASGLGDSGSAYAFAKRATHLLVRAASVHWGRRDARVNSISPGIISTPMGEAELGGPFGTEMRAMIARSGTRRLGTPDDIAATAEFLLGPGASFLTGTDILVDGGVVGALLSPAVADSDLPRPPTGA